MVQREEQGTDTTLPVAEKDRRRGLAYGLATAVTLLIIGIVTWIVLVDDGGSDSEGTSVDVARSFIEARDAWDAETTVALFAPDAIIDDLEVPRAADYSEQYQWYEAVDWHWVADECTDVVSGTDTTVTCSYTMENAWSRAMEIGPITGSMEFVIADGQIVELIHNGTKGFNGEVFGTAWSGFRTWVADNNPEDFLSMYSGNTARYTPESIVLFKKNTTEFVASLTS